MREATSTPFERVPATLQERYASIVALTNAACRAQLNEEYAMLCCKMAAALCRKRPSPVASGQVASWACSIAYCIGSVNSLFDKTQKPHLTPQALCRLFSVSQSNTAAKASQIRKLLGVHPMQPEWCLPSKLEQNPLVWMLKVNGIIMDIRDAPQEAQEVALELGLIPYLPATSGGMTK